MRLITSIIFPSLRVPPGIALSGVTWMAVLARNKHRATSIPLLTCINLNPFSHRGVTVPPTLTASSSAIGCAFSQLHSPHEPIRHHEPRHNAYTVVRRADFDRLQGCARRQADSRGRLFRYNPGRLHWRQHYVRLWNQGSRP